VNVLRTRLTLALAAAAVCLGCVSAVPAQAREFGFPVFLSPGRNQDQSPSVGAGAHPFELFTYYAVNRSRTPEKLPGGGFEGPTANVKDLRFELPEGMILYAASFPLCTEEAFNAGNCSAAAQVGVANVSLADGQGSSTTPIFNVAPPPGTVAQFAYRAGLSPVYINFHLKSGSDYRITADVNGLSAAFGVLTSSTTIWGVPGDPGHDALRYTGTGVPAPGPYPEPAPYVPLVANPTSCDAPLITTMTATTWQAPNEATPAPPFEALAVAGCNQLDFNPTIEAKPTTDLADSPSGLALGIAVPQNEDSEGLVAAHLRETKFVLPPGLTVNPSAGNGLDVCSPEQIGYAGSIDQRQILRYELPPKAFSAKFTVGFAGQETDSISSTASRSEVTQAIETLPGLAGNIVLSGGKGSWIVDFTGSLTGTRPGRMYGTVTDNPSQKVTVTGEGGGFKLKYEERVAPPNATLVEILAVQRANEEATTKELPFDASAAEVQEALRAVPLIGPENLYPGNVFVTAIGVKGLARSYRVIYAEELNGDRGPRPTLKSTNTLTGLGAGVSVSVIPPPPPLPRPLSVATLGGFAPGTPHFTEAAANCPDASKIGTVRIDAPGLVDHPLEGTAYLATPHRNPFNAFLAFYISVNDPQSGVVFKLPGLLEPDPSTGRLTATISELPQLPFADLQLEFFKGTGSLLKTGIDCGAYTVSAELTPWTAPINAVTAEDAFTIEAGAGAGPCVNDEASAPKTLSFEAGSFEPTGGAYSPFTLKLVRQDGTQRLSGIEATLPKGLIAKLAGIPYCSDAALAAAAAKNGRAERAGSSCPAASRVGGIDIAAGAGPTPYYLQGTVFLAGPYKGAPLSLAAITPAVVGPLDLGDVVTRMALYVDPESTQIGAVSDPLPSILEGIPLEIRSVLLNLDRGQFTLNPTNCGSAPITGTATALSGQSVPLKAHFQVGECGRLAFQPKLNLSLRGSTKRRGSPALKAVITTRPGNANIAQTVVTMPKSEHFDHSHMQIDSVCTRVQFAASQCPARSIYGHARVVTPLLDSPIEGPVVLRSSNTSLPDLVADLNGQLRVALAARIDTTKGGGIRISFENLPDVPISELVFELKGGKKGLLENSATLCSRASKATVLLGGQNGKSAVQSPVLSNGCKKARAGGKGSRRSRRGVGR
jgi:hypothetical protein